MTVTSVAPASARANAVATPDSPPPSTTTDGNAMVSACRSWGGKIAEGAEPGLPELPHAGHHERLVPVQKECVMTRRELLDGRSAGEVALERGHARPEPVAPLEALPRVERKEQRR